MPCFAFVRDEMTEVKNLRWLNGNIKKISFFSVRKTTEKEKRDGWNGECILTGNNDCGDIIFVSDFQSSKVLRNFLNSRIFFGIPLYWFNKKTTCRT